MEKCRVLEEYAKFVAVSRQYAATEKDMQKALNVAISYCIDHDILSDFLRKYQSEVLGMLLEEFDVEKYERTIRRESWEEGKEEGKEEGIKIGILQQQSATINKLLSKGMSEEQIADILEISTEQVEKEAKKKGSK